MTEQLNNKVSETTTVSGTDSWPSTWALSCFQLMSLLIVIGAQQTTFKPSNIKTSFIILMEFRWHGGDLLSCSTMSKTSGEKIQRLRGDLKGWKLESCGGFPTLMLAPG